MLNKSALKDAVYGAILEMARNPEIYYKSTVGRGYSHLTDKGRDVVVEYVNNMIWFMLDQEERDLDQRAKDMVLKGLKGEEN